MNLNHRPTSYYKYLCMTVHWQVQYSLLSSPCQLRCSFIRGPIHVIMSVRLTNGVRYWLLSCRWPDILFSCRFVRSEIHQAVVVVPLSSRPVLVLAVLFGRAYSFPNYHVCLCRGSIVSHMSHILEGRRVLKERRR